MVYYLLRALNARSGITYQVVYTSDDSQKVDRQLSLTENVDAPPGTYYIVKEFPVANYSSVDINRILREVEVVD